MRNPKVLVATSIAPGKQYCAGFLSRVIGRLDGKAGSLCVVDGPQNLALKFNGLAKRCEMATVSVPNDLGKVDRIAAIRNSTRTIFLGGDWTHLYFHDCDVIPPAGIIESLLALNSPIATGLCPLRNWGEIGVPILSMAVDGNIPEMIGARHFGGKIVGCGMACCLIERSVLEKTSFREGEALEGMSEDFKFCVDSNAGVALDRDSSCWHIDENGIAGKLHVGPEQRGVVYEGFPFYVRNKFGSWERGLPKFDLTEDQIDELGPGFSKGNFAPITLETKAVRQVLTKEGL